VYFVKLFGTLTSLSSYHLLFWPIAAPSGIFQKPLVSHYFLANESYLVLLGYICNPVADDPGKTRTISPCQSVQANAPETAPARFTHQLPILPSVSFSPPWKSYAPDFLSPLLSQFRWLFSPDADLWFHESVIGQSDLVGSRVPVKEGWECKPCYQ
jgi:hypothetical protein